MPAVADIAAEHYDLAGLDLARASDEAEKRGFSDAVWTDQANHPPGWNRRRHMVQRRVRP